MGDVIFSHYIIIARQTSGGALIFFASSTHKAAIRLLVVRHSLTVCLGGYHAAEFLLQTGPCKKVIQGNPGEKILYNVSGRYWYVHACSR